MRLYHRAEKHRMHIAVGARACMCARVQSYVTSVGAETAIPEAAMPGRSANAAVRQACAPFLVVAAFSPAQTQHA